MNCFKCATPIPDDSRFCLACGADVSGEGHTHEKTINVEEDTQLLLQLQQEIGGDYVIEKELGRGGMAVVFLGHDAHLGRKVAIKVLPPALTFGSPGMIERFKREARTAATLDHANIIPVHRVSTSGKLFWYVMKYLQGEALDRVMAREGQLPVDRVVSIVTQVAEGLAYAHQHQVVHRDIKPANIMIDAADKATITDFGIAKALDSSALTGSGSMIGTPYYMSPEQCSGKKVDGASDQYSLAVMTWQMLGGQLPFDGDSAVDIIRQHVMDPVPPLGALRPGLPPAIVSVIERALSKDVAARHPAIADFATALGRAAAGVDLAMAAPVKTVPRRGSKTALVSPLPGALRTARHTWLRPPLVIVAGAVAGGLLFAGALLLKDRVGFDSGPLAASDSAKPAPIGGSSDTRGADSAAVVTAPVVPVSPATLAPPRPSPARAPSRPSPAPPPAPPPAPSRPAIGWLSIITTPRSIVYVNGAARNSPLFNVEVPAGTVRLRFQVTDSVSGIWWAPDLDVNVGSGDTLRLGNRRLVRQ